MVLDSEKDINQFQYGDYYNYLLGIGYINSYSFSRTGEYEKLKSILPLGLRVKAQVRPYLAYLIADFLLGKSRVHIGAELQKPGADAGIQVDDLLGTGAIVNSTHHTLGHAVEKPAHVRLDEFAPVVTTARYSPCSYSWRRRWLVPWAAGGAGTAAKRVSWSLFSRC